MRRMRGGTPPPQNELAPQVERKPLPQRDTPPEPSGPKNKYGDVWSQ